MATKRGWIGVVAVAAVALSIIVYKESRGAPSPESVARLAAADASGSAAGAAKGSVLLFADPGEAGEACGCGRIIGLVRDAGARGVATHEIAPGSDPALEREYQVTVAPTTLLFDTHGRMIARYEGESDETVEAIRAGLDRLEKHGP